MGLAVAWGGKGSINPFEEVGYSFVG